MSDKLKKDSALLAGFAMSLAKKKKMSEEQASDEDKQSTQEADSGSIFTAIFVVCVMVIVLALMLFMNTN